VVPHWTYDATNAELAIRRLRVPLLAKGRTASPLFALLTVGRIVAV
jgi:hypothetical protein